MYSAIYNSETIEDITTFDHFQCDTGQVLLLAVSSAERYFGWSSPAALYTRAGSILTINAPELTRAEAEALTPDAFGL